MREVKRESRTRAEPRRGRGRGREAISQ
jgi:hypothetical protein